MENSNFGFALFVIKQFVAFQKASRTLARSFLVAQKSRRTSATNFLVFRKVGCTLVNKFPENILLYILKIKQPAENYRFM
ncbi:hypothetical protein [Chryseobacterium taichungense]|uniref:hypothetical protein n=1 Tax=Chryseobacterium taichungense TaxID=295069 RepID=UPI0015A671A4|nr:hypothetical protein [Chryseobacterium taichungense]